MVSISLCMIVKNEEDVLSTCLHSVKDIVDEIIIVDTGSDDKTKEIAKNYNAKIYDFEWVNDFAKARNFAFSKATKEYILWLDADDVFLEKDRKKLMDLKWSLDKSVDSVTMHYNLSMDEYGNVIFSLRRNRLVKRSQNFRWIGPVHEYLEVFGNIINSEVAVTHNPIHHDSSRNINIYKERLKKGEEFGPRDQYYFANELKDHGEYAAASDYYLQFLNGKRGWIEDNIAACSKLADCYANLGDNDKSLDAILRSFVFTAPRPEFCCKVGNHFFEKKDYYSAIYWYTQATKVNVSEDNLGTQNRLYATWIPHIQLCVCYDALGNYDRAYFHNEQAGTYRPKDPKYIHNKTYLASKIKKRILIASPIRQKPEILTHFLESLKQLECEQLEVHYYFVNDNTDPKSIKLLKQFQDECLDVLIEDTPAEDEYIKNDKTHYWNEKLIWKVAAYKNKMLQHAKRHDYDYVFLADSDLVIHPNTLKHLISQEKDIVSEVFWTKWTPEAMEQPQVWLSDEYTQYQKIPGEDITNEEAKSRFYEFVRKLRTPGIYEVGGLGACTLISLNAIQKGVSFEKINNITFWGEDRHFCVRANALGLSLWADTHYPPYHIYRDTDLDGVAHYKKLNGFERAKVQVAKTRKPRITLSMVIKNEADRYLEEVLQKHLDYIDEAVIIDDGSTDNSVEICKKVLANIPHTIIINKESKFSNEFELRKQQWEKTLETKPDWILNMDADEMFEEGARAHLVKLINQQNFDLYSFRIYDMWDNHHYREDENWRAHDLYRPFLLRYKEGFNYKWKEQKQHCGRFPENIFQLPNDLSHLRIKHFGWATPEMRKEKLERYHRLDPGATFGNANQYASILDKNPKLKKWEN